MAEDIACTECVLNAFHLTGGRFLKSSRYINIFENLLQTGVILQSSKEVKVLQSFSPTKGLALCFKLRNPLPP